LWISLAESPFMARNRQIDRWSIVPDVIYNSSAAEVDLSRRMNKSKKKYLIHYP
jgi:hypothetical protein